MFVLKYKLELFIVAALSLIFFDYTLPIQLGVAIFWFFNVLLGIIFVKNIYSNLNLQKEIVETAKVVKKNKYLIVIWGIEMVLLAGLCVSAILYGHYVMSVLILSVLIIEIIKITYIKHIKNKSL